MLPGTMFRVALANERLGSPHCSGKMRKRLTRLTTGDLVKLEISPTGQSDATFRHLDEVTEVESQYGESSIGSGRLLGFKRFETAAVMICGDQTQLSQQWQSYIKGWWNYYQLAERQWNVKDLRLAAKIKKDQFNLRPLTGKATTAPELWAAVLAS